MEGHIFAWPGTTNMSLAITNKEKHSKPESHEKHVIHNAPPKKTKQLLKQQKTSQKLTLDSLIVAYDLDTHAQVAKSSSQPEPSSCG